MAKNMRKSMTLEWIPKSELPEWEEEDEKLRLDFEERMRTGRLHIVSANIEEYTK